MEKTNLSKWFALGVGGILGISHIGMIGLLTTRNTSKLPDLNIPTGDYATYEAEVGEDGYRIRYRANDPKTMYITKDIKSKGGFLGLANNTQKVVEEYTMDGAVHHGAPVSNARTWIEPLSVGTVTEKKISAKTEACIEARGGGKQTGRLVGGSVGAAVAPSVASVPFVGWVLAGAATMIGMNKGADLGGDVAESFSKNC